MRHTVQAQYNGRPVEVAMGFDVPIGGYFMTVAPSSGEGYNPDADQETGIIYSNLDDKSIKGPGRMTSDINHYKDVLRQMNIEVPPIFFAKVLAD